MTRLEIDNPFGAPVYHEETVASTMDVCKLLAKGNAPHGTVVCADFQEAGKCRVPGRVWETGARDSLLFTVLFRFPGVREIPVALSLRTGLAVALGIEDFVPALAGLTEIKWPNDIMLPVFAEGGVYRKTAGVLVEAEGGIVRVGVGMNVLRREFPPDLRERATSVALASGIEIGEGQRFALLERILHRIHAEFETAGAADDWRNRMEARLYMKGEKAIFAEGRADSAVEFEAVILGLENDGRLLVARDGIAEPRALVAGEQITVRRGRPNI